MLLLPLFALPLSPCAGWQSVAPVPPRALGGAPGGREEVSSYFNTDSSLLHYFQNLSRGPGVMKWTHYFDIYHRHLQRFRHTDVHVLEIGVFSGGGLRMWRWYFGGRARIFGLDISNMTRAYENHPNYGRPSRIFIGDQASREFWRRFKRLVPRLDVVLDDGGHQPHQQEITLRQLLPHLAPGGVYLCEDVHGVNAFARHVFFEYVYGQTSLNSFTKYSLVGNATTLGTISELTWAQRQVAEVSFYAFVIVLEKMPRERAALHSEWRGSQWLGFFLNHGSAAVSGLPRGTGTPVIA